MFFIIIIICPQAVGTEVQRDCNFKAHICRFSYLVGRISSLWFILSSQLPYSSSNLNRLVHIHTGDFFLFRLALPSLLILSKYEVKAAHSDFDRCPCGGG